MSQLVKNLPAMRETWVWSLGKEDSPGEGKGYPLQYSGLENSMHFILHGVTKSQTQLSDFLFHSPSLASLPFPYPIPLGHHGAPDWAPCCYAATSHQLSTLHLIVYICWCYFHSSYKINFLKASDCPIGSTCHFCFLVGREAEWVKKRGRPQYLVSVYLY